MPEETSFPRGGRVSRGKAATNKPKEDQDLFKDHEAGSNAAKKRQKRQALMQQKKQKKKAAIKSIQKKQSLLFQPDLNKAEILQQKTVSVNMLVLGCIKQIHDYELVVSLPGGLCGTVPITAISDAYTGLLQRLADAALGMEMEDLSSLYELFRVGQPVRCKVTNVSLSTTKNKGQIKLTINPREVNTMLVPTALRTGMVLSAAVASVEDHGIALDLGIKGLNCFLKTKEVKSYVQDYRDGEPLHPGTVLDVMVEMSDMADLMSGESRSVKVVVEPKKVYRSQMLPSFKVTLLNLLPGMQVAAEVSNILKDGVTVKFLRYKGTIHYTHLGQSPQNLKPGEKLRASILFIHPTTKALSLTCLPHLMTPDLVPRKLFGELNAGDIVEEAEIFRHEEKRGIILKIADKTLGLAIKTQLSDKEVDDPKVVFKKHSTHRCRVTGFDYCEGIVFVSLKKSILNQQFMSLQDIHPAATIQCTVLGFHNEGVSVKISPQIRGFIPSIHTADVPLKRPEMKLTVESTIKCKVLSVNPDRQQVIVTLKKSLLKSKYDAVISYDDFTEGKVVEGVIVHVRDNGVLVAFYNNVKGFVPRKELSTTYIEYPERVFFRGQVVRCRVLNITAEKKAFLSFKIEGPTPFASQPVKAPVDFKVGRMVRCKIKEKLEKGLNVEIIPNGINAFLPKVHLSDHMNNCELLWNTYQIGQVLEVMYIWKGNDLLVSKKPSLLRAIWDGFIVQNFEDIHLGMELIGTVKRIVEYGVFIEFTNKVSGLVPSKLMYDSCVSDHKTLYQIGQSVVAKVAEVNKEKQNFVLSLRERDCYHGDVDTGLDLLEQYLKERSIIATCYVEKERAVQLLRKYSCGDVVKVKVTDVSDDGAVCETHNKISAIVDKYHLKGGDYKSGKWVDAVVLFVDQEAKQLEISLDEALVQTCRENYSANKKELVGENLSCRIELVKEDFVLASVQEKSGASMVYLPVKRFLNDVLDRKQYKMGDTCKIFVERMCGSSILGRIGQGDSAHQKVFTCLKEGDMIECLVEIQNSNGVKVKITKDLYGFIPKHFLDASRRFRRGQKLKCKVIKSSPSVILTNKEAEIDKLARHPCIEEVNKVSCSSLGMLERCSVTKKEENILEVRLDSGADAVIPVEHLSDHLDNCKLLWEVCQQGQELEVVHLYSYGATEKKHLVVSQRPSVLQAAKEGSLCTQLDNLRPGTPVHCTVTASSHRSVTVELFNKKKYEVPKQFARDTWHRQKFVPFRPGQAAVAMVMYPVESLADYQPLLSLRAADSYPGNMDEAIEHLAQYLRERQVIINFLSRNQEDKLLVNHCTGQVVTATVTHKTPIGLLVSLEGGVKGLVTAQHMEGIQPEACEVGQKLEGVVLFIDTEAKCLELSIKPRLIKQVKKLTSRGEQARVGQTLKGSEVQLVKEDFSLVSLGGHLHGKLAFLQQKQHLNDLAVRHEVGEKCNVIVKRISGENILVSFLGNEKFKDRRPLVISRSHAAAGMPRTHDVDHDVEQSLIKRRKLSEDNAEGLLNKPDSVLGKKTKNKGGKVNLFEDDSPSSVVETVVHEKKKKKRVSATEKGSPSRKKKKLEIEEKDSGMESEEDHSHSRFQPQSPTSQTAARLSVSANFNWSDDFSLPAIPDDNQYGSDSDSSDSIDLEETKVKRKQTKQERLALAKMEESKMFQKGTKAGAETVESAQQFDKLVLQSPNSSGVWIRYMSFLLNSAEADGARTVAERALRTISFREEQEKLKVWVAYLDLENTHGTPEQLDAVLRRALQHNEQKKVYTQMAHVYVKSGKIEAAEQCYNIMARKFSLVKDVWVSFGMFYFVNGNAEGGRKILPRSLKSLDQRDHVETIAKFAQMEFKFGEPERGKTMFENVLSSYPKRTDLWSVYIDMLVRLNEVEAVRTLFERVIQLPLPAKKMKVLFKKYLDFEEKFGSEDAVAAVKQKAMDYVESKGSSL